jgi:hypothetical protein
LDILTALLRFAIVVAFAVGTPVIWLILLNRRDRRQLALAHGVLDRVNSRDLRGRVAVQARSGLLWGRSVVTVDVLASSRNEVWEIMTRLSRHLSPRVRLEVTGEIDQDLIATLVVEPMRRLPRPAAPSLATG